MVIDVTFVTVRRPAPGKAFGSVCCGSQLNASAMGAKRVRLRASSQGATTTFEQNGWK